MLDPRRQRQVAAAAAAAFCLGPPPRRRSAAQVPPDRLEEAVRSRPRAWRDTWADRVVQNEFDPMGWRVLRSLLRDQECEKPEGADYIRSMVRHAAWLGDPGRPRRDLYLPGTAPGS